jgi:galactokinase
VAQVVVKWDLPQGAGLSSSAALETASAVFLGRLSGTGPEGLDLVKAAQEAENRFVGVACGIMDPYASYFGEAGCALLLDCRSLVCRSVPLPNDLKVVVCHTGVERGLAGSAYNERRAECDEGVRVLARVLPGLDSLRGVTPQDLERHGGDLTGKVLKRVRHVVTEDARVLATVTALEAGDKAGLGRLLGASHDSLRDDFEVSCPELDALVDVARGLPGVHGARMTGAGFGGCTVNLVEAAAVEGFVREVKARHRTPEVYVFTPAPGAKYG